MVEVKERWCDKATKLGIVRQRIEQDEILVDGTRVGYCGTHRGAPLTLLMPVAEATLHAIKYELDKRDQSRELNRRVSVAPRMMDDPTNEAGDE